MNTLFPGRPNYTGPKKGWFALLHHDCLFEYSLDVTERVEYVRSCKPKNEIAVRLRNMLYLGDCPAVIKRGALEVDYKAERDVLSADCAGKRAVLSANYEAKCKLYAGCRANRKLFTTDYAAEGEALYADYVVRCNTLYADYVARCNTLYTNYKARYTLLDAEILEYIKVWIPDCPWDGETLVFNGEYK